MDLSKSIDVIYKYSIDVIYFLECYFDFCVEQHII